MAMLGKTSTRTSRGRVGGSKPLARMSRKVGTARGTGSPAKTRRPRQTGRSVR